MFKHILDKLKSEEPSYIELDMQKPQHNGKISIQVESMEDYSDSERIQNKVRDGYILLVKIRDLKNKDLAELKRAVARIRKTSTASNGDIAGIGEDWLLVTPASARIQK